MLTVLDIEDYRRWATGVGPTPLQVTPEKMVRRLLDDRLVLEGKISDAIRTLRSLA